MWASTWGKSDIVKLLIEKGTDINAKNNSGETALILTSDSSASSVPRGYQGNTATVNTVKLLLEKGADINAKDYEGKTALMKASVMGYTNIVKLLIEKGADVNARTQKGCPLMCVSVDLLIKVAKGAKNIDVNEQSPDGYTALKLASQMGYTKIVELLKQAGAKE